MNIKIEASWKDKLNDEFQKDYFLKLVEFVKQEYATQTIYPIGKNIFKAFELCPFTNVNVVIIGQDPYHGEGQAHGLCFSVPEGVKLPPSLKNIFNELMSDLSIPKPESGCLEHWAKQGVLLLNATLTVRAGEAGSHQKKGWEEFTDAVIQKINNNRSNVVFILWGAYAQKKASFIDTSKHLVLKSAHPSPFSVTKFLGNKHFSQANTYLLSKGKLAIDWS